MNTMPATVRLKNHDWEALIAPEYGMNTLALYWQGIPILRSPKNIEEFLSAPETFGIPALMPASRTADARFTFEGKDYSLPCNEPIRNCHKHGILHRSQFHINITHEHALSASYRDNAEYYPFTHEVLITCEIRNDGYHQTFTIKNLDSKNMPVIFALHTSFKKPSFLKIPIGNRWLLNERVLPTGEFIPLNDFEQSLVSGRLLDDQIMGGCYTSCGNTVLIDEFFYRVSDNFTQWILWNQDGNKDFLCIEPQSGPINSLNMPTCLTLLPDSQITFTIHIGKRTDY
ncbi:MAG: aldose 1-epimerase [Sphaerochaetaceae bacterium]|jgi:aldose 1-epimerase|nr:aldose 1-epimerase [Sphaerochaetaceae bacterium]